MSQYHISLTFTADTAKARAQVQELSKALNSLALNTNLTDKSSIYQIDEQLQSASVAARQLQSALELALNPKTGKLDLSRFQDVLKKSGKSLQDFERDLTAIGPEGQHAFNTLCTSIMQAELPLKRTNKLVDKLWDSLKKTVTWQVTSTVTHGIWGGVEKAYRYAQDLNQSLTDIQIVTGKSSDEMARFAKSANQAAKSLSTTTTKYTEASLIYFQQGLNQKEVEERTALTVKMANVTGESVSTVSQQLTAVWNNFYDGSKSLEYYIDVMTALGAATASSSDEISEGLNKFAAVAETVGLSYEYAASALATVTATTRESADIVGNAFKTLFARIQGLKLGETLEDGTDLNKYSAALKSVGIDIKDVNGEIRDMDDILDEMGQKWTTLNKDQQIALAQTVAGVRQYNQLVALMDNWSFFQENLNTAMTSTGTLAEQAEIYEKSWKAANERVRASAEGLYDSLINDEFFIDLANAAAGFLSILEEIIDGMGGAKGLLLAGSSIITRLASAQIANTLRDMAYNVRSLFGINQKEAIAMKQQAGQLLFNQYDTGGDTDTFGASHMVAEAERQRAKLQMQYINNGHKLSEIEAKNLQIIFDGEAALIDRMKVIDETTAKLREQNAEHQKGLDLILEKKDVPEMVENAVFNNQKGTRSFIYQNITKNAALQDFVANSNNQDMQKLYADLIERGKGKNLKGQGSDYYRVLQADYNRFAAWVNQNRVNLVDVKAEINKFSRIQKELGRFKLANTGNVTGITRDNLAYAKDYAGLIDRIATNLADIKDDQGNALINEADVQRFTQLANKTNQTDAEIKELDDLFKKFNLTLNKIGDSKSLDTLISKLNLTEKEAAEVKDLLEKIKQTQASGGTGEEEIAQLLNIIKSKGGEGGKILQGAGKQDWADTATSIANAASNVGFFASSLDGAMTSLQDGETSVADFTSVIGLFTSGVTTATTLFKLFTTVLKLGAGPAGWAVAAIMALVTVIQLAIKAEERRKEALEAESKAASETAEKLSENLKNVKNKAEEVRKTFEEYHTLTDNLNDLAEGTNEWYIELGKVQEKMREIINMYPELIGTEFNGEKAFDFDAITGLYTMGSWVEQYANEQIAIASGVAEIGNVIGAIRLAQDTLQKQREKLNSDLSNNVIKEYNDIHSTLSSPEFNGVSHDYTFKIGNQSYKSQTSADGSGGIGGTVLTEGIYQNHSVEELAWYQDQLQRQAQKYIQEGLITNIEDWDAVREEVQASIEESRQLSNSMSGTSYNLTADAMEGLNADFRNFLEEQLVIYDNYEIAMRQHVEFIKTQNIQLAQSLLSSRRSFQSLDADEKTAATILSEQVLTAATQKWDAAWKNDGGLTGSGNTWGRVWGDGDEAIAFRKLLAGAVGVTPADGDWQGKKDLGYNFENSSLGKAVVERYLALEGITGEATQYRAYDMKIEGSTVEGSLGNDYYVSYDQMLARIMSEYLNTELNEEEIIAQVQDISNGKFGKAIIAGITGNFNSLTPEQIKEISGNYDGFNDQFLNEWASSMNMDRAALEETDMYKEAITALQNYDEALAKTQALQRDVAAGNSLIAQAASELDMDEKTLQNYAKTLQTVNAEQQLTYEQAAKLAIANARLSKGMAKLREDFDDYYKILKTGDKKSYEVIEAATEMATILSDVFGVELSSDFALNPDNLEKIKKALEGDVQSLQELERAAAEDFILHLTIDEEYKTQLVDIINYLDGLPEAEIGMKASLDPSYIDQLNQMLEDGVITADQLTNAFSTIGWSPNIKYKDELGPETKTTMSGKITYDGNKVAELSGDFTSQATIKVPYIDSDDSGTGAGAVTSLGQKDYSSNLTSKLPNKTGGGGNKKDPKNLDDEKERYYEINEALDDLAKKLDLIDKKKSRAFGKAKLDLIQEEIDVIDEEIDKTQDLIDAITQDIPADMANLAAFGATFDKNNNITNYDEIYAAEVNAYNAAVATGDESKIAAAEKRWELFTKALEQYEETMDAYDDAIAKQTENKIKKYEKLFESVTYSIEVKLDIQDDQMKLLDHMLTMIEDKAFSAAEAIGLLGQKTQVALNQASIYSQGITDLLALHGLDNESIQAVLNGSMSIDELDEYGFSDEDISQLREYMDGLMQCNEDLLELRNTVQEKVVEAFDEFNEELDRNIEKIEYLTGVIDSLRNIIDLVGQASLGLDDEFMNNLANAKVQTSTDNLTANKAKYDSNVSQLASAQEQLRLAQERGDEESVKQWTKTVNDLTTKVQDSHNAMLSSWENALQAAQEAFELAVDQAIATYEKAISGTFGNLEDLQNAFDQQSEILDRYVEDYEKIYELSKLNRDINNSIDLTGNVKAKQALRDLQVEINELQASDTKMSEYDLKYLRQKYNLRLAEIALEEAQNAKSQVRMRKDSEGNYSYVFTADENKIEEARQNYEDALYEMQDLNTQYIREMQANILQSEIELANALRALDRTKYKSDAEYYAEVDRITAYYMGQRSYYMGELDKGLQNNQTTYAYDWYNYSQYTGYKISADEDYIDSFNETVYAQLTGYTSIEDAQNKFKQATEIMVEDLKTAFTNWQNAIKIIMEAAGTSIETFGETTSVTLEQIVTDSGEAAEEVTEDAEQFVDAFAIICDEVTNWQIVYSSAISEAVASNTEMIGSCGSLISMLSEVDGKLVGTGQQFATTAGAIEAAAARIQAAAAAAAAAAASVNSTSVSTTSPSVNPTNPTTSTDVKLDPYVYYKDKNAVTGRSQAYAPVSASSITSSGWEVFQGTYLVEKGYGNTRKAVLISAYLASPGAISIAKFSPLKNNSGLGNFPGLGFDTGGYTGSWGEDGRIAMLHQKELVLNAADTENMLKAVEIVRNIVKVIDLNAGAQSQGLGTLSTGTAQVGDQVLEQSVMITAEFPNATDHNEIEMAFDTLINRASQFANRKKM